MTSSYGHRQVDDAWGSTMELLQELSGVEEARVLISCDKFFWFTLTKLNTAGSYLIILNYP